MSYQGGSTSSLSSFSSTPRWKYDVFLSFRSEDTRNNFTDHLYAALKQKGIFIFREDEKIERGKSIGLEVLKAIEESRFAIVILSENYVSSTWCLVDLAKIIDCMQATGMIVLPVFYYVDPSDVRKQTGPFKEAWLNLEERFKDNMEKVHRWRNALTVVGNLSGWLVEDGHESEIIQHIVKGITEKLSSKSSSINKNLIGIKSMVAELIPSYLGFGNDIYMMGICGMRGLGKTSLASAIYYEYFDHFEGSSFIANVRERSEKGELHELQQQLLDEILEGSNIKIYNVQVGVKKIKSSGLRHKKVLLVLDDVNHKDQLEKLAGVHDWFGLGSWIIITTRDEHVLVDLGVLKIYKPNGLDDDDASKLFSLKAFKKEQPEEGYMQLSQKVVEYARGLPLALVTLGSFLVGRTIEEWQSALDSFKNIKWDIHDILKISYDGLEEMWKEIFLDIACFFRGQKKDKVIQILENCGFDARIGVSVLVERSLLTVDYKGRFGMHDLLSEMGQKIIRFESGGKLGKQSRLWLVEDLLHVLENDMATEAIQAIVVEVRNEYFNLEEFSVGFSKMSNLRLLIIDKESIPNDQGHLALPNNLRYLSWRDCLFKCLASSHKRMAFVQLDLQFSKFEYLWKGVMHSVNLKFIDLRYSYNLIRTPDFSGVPILEELKLCWCHRLVEIHPSIGKLSKLRYLHLKGCFSLTDLPSMSAEMQSLTVLNLYCCYKISSFPRFTGIMKSLSELNLGGTAIKEVPSSSIKCLTTLTLLNLSFCLNLKCLPSNLDNLRSLETLSLSRCKKLKSLPRLPSTVRNIHAKGCSSLKSLPRLPSTVRYISVQNCSSLKWIPARVKLSIWSQPLSRWLSYDGRGSRVGTTILFYFLQGLICRKAFLDGFIIPSCLAEIERNSISIELPSNWNNSKWIGFALWASLSDFISRASDYTDFEDGIRARVIALVDMPQNHCAFELFTTWIHCGVSICLLYLSSDDWFATVGNDECSQIKVIFETNKRTLYLRECGVSLIYKQDVEDFNQTNAQCLIERFGKVSIYKLTAGDDDDDDVHIVD